MADFPPERSPRIAGAPISWGVSEVPGWGVQLPPERVLAEMREVGFTATELGPDGFLPDAPAAKAGELGRFDLAAVGSFVPVVLHRDAAALLPAIDRVLDDYDASGAQVLVLAAVTGEDGYDDRPATTEAEWSTLFANLDRVRTRAAERGYTAVLHPHVGTVVESKDDVDRVLAGSTIGFCFDTGHLMIGGTDPVAFVAEHADRIEHVHLKDVSRAGIDRVASGAISYYDAIVADSLYRPLGQGDVDLRTILGALDATGYDGWFVLEQDQVLAEEPRAGDGPIRDARESVDYLRAVLGELAASRGASS